MAIAPPKVDVTAEPSRFEEAIRAFRARVPISDDDWKKLRQEKRAEAFKVANVTAAQMVKSIFDAIDAHIANGTSTEAFKANVGDALETTWGGPRPGQIENILRTNAMGAYNAGRYEVQSAPAVKSVRPYLRLDVIEDSATSEYCKDLDATILEQDDEWWDHNYPPRHFQCRSHATALREREAIKEGITDPAPKVKAMEGFGQRPSAKGKDWEPDLKSYPPAIRDELRDRIADD